MLNIILLSLTVTVIISYQSSTQQQYVFISLNLYFCLSVMMLTVKVNKPCSSPINQSKS